MQGRHATQRCLGGVQLAGRGTRHLRTAAKERESPWIMHGGKVEHLAVELLLGLFELKRGAGAKLWTDPDNRKRATMIGRTMELYTRKTLATKSRCRLWERFREDLEASIKAILKDETASVMMMGGAAQGMATVDGDVDLTIFLPSKIQSLQEDRTAVRSVLHLIGRGLKKQGFDGFVVPARVPIIQYRPDPALERLFTYEGSDEMFRFLRLKSSVQLATATQEQAQRIFMEAKELAKRLQTELECRIRVHRSRTLGVLLEFPMAAEAFSAMYRCHRQFDLVHLVPQGTALAGKQSSGKLSSDALLSPDQVWSTLLEQAGKPAAGAKGERSGPVEKEAADAAPAPRKGAGLVTIADILKTAAANSPSFSSAYVPYPFAVDISVAVTPQPWGPRNSELLRRYLSTDPRVQTLAMFVKWWSKHSVPVSINNSRAGWLTSYCVLVMLIHFLIHEKRLQFIDPLSIEPVLRPDTRYPCTTPLTEEDHVQVVRDFVKFCEYYATGFDYEKEVISLVSGRKKTKDECSAKVMSARHTALIIEDPYEDRSLGHPIDHRMLVKIQSTFFAASREITCQIAGISPSVYLKDVVRETAAPILRKNFSFDNDPPKGACCICQFEEPAEGATECTLCLDALQKSTIPLEFFAERTGQAASVPAEVSIREQKKQERSLKEAQFLARHHKGARHR
ncbi:UTP:RNA uridylyltransferase 1 [Diplonema papillatum]|nr:UTP:RNA uridylyltransferase 1 [Diplonema papillatum]